MKASVIERYCALSQSVAGVALAFAGPALCYAVDAFSWLIMLGALALIRADLPQRGGWRTVSLGALGAGLRFVWRHPVIFPLALMDFGANLFGTVRALLPVFARDILLVGPEGLGLLYAASAIGSLLGAVGFSFVGRTRGAGRWILGGVTIYGACVVSFALSEVFWLSMVCLIGYGIGDTISAILRATITQLSTPDELRGRMASIHSLFTNSGPQLGQFQAGALASLLGAEIAATGGGLMILLIVAVLALGFPKVRDYRIGEET